MKQGLNEVLFIGTGQVGSFIQELCPSMEEVKRGIRLSGEVMIEVLRTIQYWVGFHWALVTVGNGKNYRIKRLGHREIWESREMGGFMCWTARDQFQLYRPQPLIIELDSGERTQQSANTGVYYAKAG